VVLPRLGGARGRGLGGRGGGGGGGVGAARHRGDRGARELAVGLRRLRRRRTRVGGRVVHGVRANGLHAPAFDIRPRRDATAVDATPGVAGGVGSRRRKVPDRRGLVLLHLVAAEIRVRWAALGPEAGRLVCLGRRRRAW